MKNLGTLTLVCALLGLGGCATAPIPDGYSGPIASIHDSSTTESANRAQFFYLSAINGNSVNNVLAESRKANHGRGFSMNPVSFSRELPAQRATLTLEAQVSYGAPIQAILNAGTVYTASKSIEFAPEPNRSYVVRGELSATRQEVWLEDADTGKRVAP